MLAALLCGALLCACPRPFASFAPAALAAEQDSDPTSKRAVKDTQVNDRKDDEGELPLIDPAAGDAASPNAAGGGDEADVLSGSGVTATGKAQGGAVSRGGAASPEPQRPLSLRPLWNENSGRFVIGEEQAGAPAKKMAKPAPGKPPAKPAARAKPATTSKLKKAAGKPAQAPAGQRTGKAVAPGAAAPGLPAAKPEAPVVVSTDTVEDTAAQEIMPGGEVPPSLPPGETLVQTDNPKLSDYFTPEELAGGASDSVLADNSGSAGAAPPDGTQTVAGVIATAGGLAATPPPASPTVSQALRGAGAGVGSGVVPMSPWRSGAVLALCLALVFSAMWAAGKLRGRFPAGMKRAMALIESISVGPGRQICIVELGQDALVLGVTPQSINLLDKLPLAGFTESYNRTVQTIIHREATAPASAWAERPAFTAGGAPPLTPPRPQRPLLPAEPVRMRVSELRAARQASTPVRTGRSAVPAPTRFAPATLRQAGTYDRRGFARAVESRLSKDELIGRLRAQLDQLER